MDLHEIGGRGYLKRPGRASSCLELSSYIVNIFFQIKINEMHVVYQTKTGKNIGREKEKAPSEERRNSRPRERKTIERGKEKPSPEKKRKNRARKSKNLTRGKERPSPDELAESQETTREEQYAPSPSSFIPCCIIPPVFVQSWIYKT